MSGATANETCGVSPFGRADPIRSRVFFSSDVKTWCIGTNVWWVMFTRRSASENSSNRNWFDIATITCFGTVL